MKMYIFCMSLYTYSMYVSVYYVHFYFLLLMHILMINMKYYMYIFFVQEPLNIYIFWKHNGNK